MTRHPAVVGIWTEPAGDGYRITVRATADSKGLRNLLDQELGRGNYAVEIGTGFSPLGDE